MATKFCSGNRTTREHDFHVYSKEAVQGVFDKYVYTLVCSKCAEVRRSEG